MFGEEEWVRQTFEDIARGEEVGGKLAIGNNGRSIVVVNPGPVPDGAIVGVKKDFEVFGSGHCSG